MSNNSAKDNPVQGLIQKMILQTLQTMAASLLQEYTTGTTVVPGQSAEASESPSTPSGPSVTEFYTSYDQLPLMLSADEIIKVLRVSRSSIYTLLHSSCFPRLRINNRLLVPKDKFKEWLDNQIYNEMQ